MRSVLLFRRSAVDRARTVGRLLCCLFLITASTGCADLPANDLALKAISFDLRIEPGQRIGPLRIDGTLNELARIIGPGRLEGRGFWRWSVTHTWQELGLMVVSDSGTGHIMWMSIDTTGANPWARHATREGLGLGVEEKDILTHYGTPDRVVTGGGKSLYYEKRGIRFLLNDSGPRTGKVASIRIVWPSVPRGDMSVVAGYRISGIEIGAAIGPTLDSMGGGYHRGFPDKDHTLYYWPHLALTLIAIPNQVAWASVARDHPNDGLTLRYETAEGLRLGSGTDRIIQVHGEPPEKTECAGWECWIYRSHGISFSVNDNREIQRIDVFRPTP